MRSSRRRPRTGLEATLFHTRRCHGDVSRGFHSLAPTVVLRSCGLWPRFFRLVPTARASWSSPRHSVTFLPRSNQGCAQRSSPASSHHFATKASKLGLRPQHFPKQVSSQVSASILLVYLTLTASACARSPVPALALCRSILQRWPSIWVSLR